MLDNDTNNLIGLSKEALKVANNFLEKIDNTYLKAIGIKRNAKAEAEAKRILAEADIETEELKHRSTQRLLLERMVLQSNLENIVIKSIPYLNEDHDTERIDDDWLFNYITNCQMISDDELQELWAKILAGEANESGSFSKRTVNYMKDINKDDAELIENLCNFVWKIDNASLSLPMILDHEVKNSIYVDNGIDFAKIDRLSEIGIIKLADRMVGVYATPKIPLNPHQIVVLSYQTKPLIIAAPEERSKSYDSGIHHLDLGIAKFTQVGSEISIICNIKPINGFYEYVNDIYNKELITQTSN